MDWSKAKNILIVSFLILNLLLAYRLYLEPALALATEGLSKEQMEAIEAMLGKHSVKLQASLPATAPRLPVMNIRLRAFSISEVEKLRDSLLGPNATPTSQNSVPLDDQPVSFVNGSEILTITSRGYVRYQNINLADTGDTITSEQAVKIAEEFLKDCIGAWPEFILDSVSNEYMGYLVSYVHKNKDAYVFPGYIWLIVRPSGVAAMSMCRLETSTQRFVTRTGLTAHEALLNLLSHRLNTGETGALTIYGVDFGYYSTIYDSEQWEAPPVWRVRTDVGDYYINAKSGIIEQ